MRGRRGTFLEARLVNPGLEEVGGQGSHLGHDGLLEDFGDVRPHHNWSDVLEFRLVYSLVLREGYQSALIQVFGDAPRVVQQAKKLVGDLLGEAMGRVPRLKNSPIKSIWA